MYVFFPVMRQTLALLCPPLALQRGICTFIDPCPPKSLYRKWPSSSVVYLLHCQTLSPDGWWEWKCQINILIKTLSFTLTVRGRRRRHREFIFVYAKDLKYSNGNHPYPWFIIKFATTCDDTYHIILSSGWECRSCFSRWRVVGVSSDWHCWKASYSFANKIVRQIVVMSSSHVMFLRSN